MAVIPWRTCKNWACARILMHVQRAKYKRAPTGGLESPTRGASATRAHTIDTPHAAGVVVVVRRRAGMTGMTQVVARAVAAGVVVVMGILKGAGRSSGSQPTAVT